MNRSEPANPSPHEKDADDDSPLFRPESMAARRPQMTGEVLLSTRALSTWAALFALLVAALLIAFVTWGSYTRRTTVVGYLEPSEGTTRITAPQPGVVVEQTIQEGASVKKGDPLFVLSTDRQGADSVGYQASISGSMQDRLRSIQQERLRAEEAARTEVESLRKRVVQLQAERRQVARQLEDLQRRALESRRSATRYKGLLDQGLVTQEQWAAKDTEAAELRARAQALARDDMALEREAAQVSKDADAAQARRAAADESLAREAAAVREQYAEAEARRRVVLTAPRDGVATLVHTSVGAQVDGARPLATLVASDAPLQAMLYAPSRTVGFVKPGTTVWLRYAAFPFQKFGHHRGEVVAVSAFPAVQEELAGLYASPDGQAEPVYAVKVQLQGQSVQAYGVAQALRAGMRVEADFLLERRRLWEWALEPLITLGRPSS
jgi:membrane fusion protein